MQHFILCVCSVKQHTRRQGKEQSSLSPFSSLTHNPPQLREHAAAAAAAKSLVVSNFVRPGRLQPMKLPPPWASPGQNSGAGCHFFLQCRKVKSESGVAHRV